MGAAWLQLGEQPSLAEAAGMGLIVGAPAVLAWSGLTTTRCEHRTAGAEPDVRPLTD